MSQLLATPMAIKWRLTAVMADREVDNEKLQELTGFHPGTISKLRNNPPRRIDVETLDKLCQALACTPGDLLRYVPGQDQKVSNDKPLNN